MRLKTWSILAFALSLTVRLYLNFSQNLIPGTNGGYYPLQVRSILMKGHLGFSDMPLLFYLNAYLVKAVSLLGVSVSDQLIIQTVKWTDSLIMPMLVIPFLILMNLKKSAPTLSSVAVLLFVTLSLQPLILTSDLQKNALAILFSVFGLAYLLAFLERGMRRNLLLAGLFFMLTGLTHFGTLAFCVLYGSLLLFFRYKSKAIIPFMLLIAAALGIVWNLDRTRFFRLLTFWEELFEHSALLHGMLGPPELLQILLAITMGGWAVRSLAIFGDRLSENEKGWLLSSAICLFLFSFPLLDIEYLRRLGLFAFLLEAFILVILSKALSLPQIRTGAVLLILFTGISVVAMVGNKKHPALSAEAYKDLKQMRQALGPGESQRIFIARHGLEWWIAWALNAKVAQEKAVDEALHQTYRDVFVVRQVRGFPPGHDKMPFREPVAPPNAAVVYASDYFKVYRWVN
ncbi:MAG: hypothetical protein KBG02_11240 [Haliscomenobacter sp.]|nr:hypothetical protein [Haliscomenobacter sp.]